jgi:plasmid rolling circle replication initiator protein Rep
MAKLIEGYEPALKKYRNLQFVTLTIPNVTADNLRESLDTMYKNFRRITDTMRKKKIAYAGIRKTEVTYNSTRKDFHPHFHLIVEGDNIAKTIVRHWLDLNKQSNIKAQDIRQANEKSIKELFKYTAKVVSKINNKQVIIVQAVDTIMLALHKRRIVQPFGEITKYVDEEIKEEDLKSDKYNIPEYDLMSWTWVGQDWVNEYGETLTGYEPSETIKSIEFG